MKLFVFLIVFNLCCLVSSNSKLLVYEEFEQVFLLDNDNGIKQQIWNYSDLDINDEDLQIHKHQNQQETSLKVDESNFRFILSSFSISTNGSIFLVLNSYDGYKSILKEFPKPFVTATQHFVDVTFNIFTWQNYSFTVGLSIEFSTHSDQISTRADTCCTSLLGGVLATCNCATEDMNIIHTGTLTLDSDDVIITAANVYISADNIALSSGKQLRFQCSGNVYLNSTSVINISTSKTAFTASSIYLAAQSTVDIRDSVEATFSNFFTVTSETDSVTIIKATIDSPNSTPQNSIIIFGSAAFIQEFTGKVSTFQINGTTDGVQYLQNTISTPQLSIEGRASLLRGIYISDSAIGTFTSLNGISNDNYGIEIDGGTCAAGCEAHIYAETNTADGSKAAAKVDIKGPLSDSNFNGLAKQFGRGLVISNDGHMRNITCYGSTVAGDYGVDIQNNNKYLTGTIEGYGVSVGVYAHKFENKDTPSGDLYIFGEGNVGVHVFTDKTQEYDNFTIVGISSFVPGSDPGVGVIMATKAKVKQSSITGNITNNSGTGIQITTDMIEPTASNSNFQYISNGNIQIQAQDYDFKMTSNNLYFYGTIICDGDLKIQGDTSNNVFFEEGGTVSDKIECKENNFHFINGMNANQIILDANSYLCGSFDATDKIESGGNIFASCRDSDSVLTLSAPKIELDEIEGAETDSYTPPIFMEATTEIELKQNVIIN